MSATGYIQLHAYTSLAQMPLQDAAVVLFDENSNIIAMRLTDRNGLISPIEIPVPELIDSQTPGVSRKPYTSVNIYAYLDGYEPVESDNVQVFAGTTTYQELEMIPIPEAGNPYEERIIYYTPPQDL